MKARRHLKAVCGRRCPVYYICRNGYRYPVAAFLRLSGNGYELVFRSRIGRLIHFTPVK